MSHVYETRIETFSVIHCIDNSRKPTEDRTKNFVSGASMIQYTSTMDAWSLRDSDGDIRKGKTNSRTQQFAAVWEKKKNVKRYARRMGLSAFCHFALQVDAPAARAAHAGRGFALMPFLPTHRHWDLDTAEFFSSLPYIKHHWNAPKSSDLSHHWPDDRDHTPHSGPQSNSSHSSHDSWGTSLMSSHSDERFNHEIVPDYFQHAKMQQPHIERANVSSLDYLAPQHEVTQPQNISQFLGWSETPHLQWGVSAGVPFVPDSIEEQIRDSQFLSLPHNFPLVGDLRTWPPVFHKNSSTTSPKRHSLACLFCRERKIGCSRPAKDDPNQTCK
ncbi:hypothetical protein K438DRAFT_1749455 [Mycena galopus ATCC 62051]|nr:hypothetical protein K438DRAFT_1749455 [Mycena galopus ATCC 62051]